MTLPMPNPNLIHAERDAIVKAVADAMTASGEFDGGLAWLAEDDTRVAFWQYIGGTNGWGAWQQRQLIPATLIQQGGGSVSVVFQAGTGSAYDITAASIGHQAQSGNGWDFESTPVPITFSGSASAQVPAGGQLESDFVAFDLDNSKNVLVAIYRSGGATNDDSGANTSSDKGCINYAKSGATQAETVSDLAPSGFDGSIIVGGNYSVAAIKVSGASYDSTGDYLSNDEAGHAVQFIVDDWNYRSSVLFDGVGYAATGAAAKQPCANNKAIAGKGWSVPAICNSVIVSAPTDVYMNYGAAGTGTLKLYGGNTQDPDSATLLATTTFADSANANHTITSTDGRSFLFHFIEISFTSVPTGMYCDNITFDVDFVGAPTAVIDLPSSAITEVVDSYETAVTSVSADIYSSYPLRGQCITLPSGRNITKVAFYLQKIGAPTGTAYIYFQGVTGTVGSTGYRDTVNLCDPISFDVSALSTTAGWVEFELPVPLQAVGNISFFVYYAGGSSSACIRLYYDNAGVHAGNYVGPSSYIAAADSLFKLHAEKHPRRKMIDGYAASNSSNVRWMYSTGNHGYGQATYLNNGDCLTNLRFYLGINGAPTGTYKIAIYNAAGSPYNVSGDALYSKDFAVSRLTTDLSMTCNSIDFIAPSDGWYIVTCEYSGGDTSNYLKVGTDNTSPTHNGNLCALNSSDVWSGDSAYDTCFELYGYTPRDNRRIQPYLLHSGGDYRNDVKIDVGTGEKLVKRTGDTVTVEGVNATTDITSTSLTHYTDSGSTATNISDNNNATFVQTMTYIAVALGRSAKVWKLRLNFNGTQGWADAMNGRKFQGSNDSTNGTNGTWTDLVTLASLGANWTDFVLASPDYYTMYRLTGGGTGSDIYCEWELYEVEGEGTYNILRAPLQRIDHLTQALPQCRVHLKNNTQRIKGVVLIEED